MKIFTIIICIAVVIGVWQFGNYRDAQQARLQECITAQAQEDNLQATPLIIDKTYRAFCVTKIQHESSNK